MKICLFLLSLIIAGCQLGPPYEVPTSDVPADWKAANYAASPPPCVDFFWEVFQDETLNALERQAVDNSPSLYSALEKVVEARAVAGSIKASLYPQITLSPLYSNTATLFKLYGLSAIPAIIGAIPSILRVHEMEYFLPLNVNYEVDLWGKLRGQYASAFFNAQAQEDAFRTSLLTLTTDLAADYFNLRSLDAQINLLEKTILLRKKSLGLTTSRYKGGLGNDLDVSQSELELANTESLYQDTIRQRNLFENAIATLVGVPASLFCLPPNPLIDGPPVIPAGIPSEILFQRPDIAEAERKIASEHALIGPAYAAFFPSLSLTGTLGYFSPDFKDFLTWKGRYWSLGANSNESIFDGYRNISNLKISWARFREASGDYQQQVLTAFEEVENALNNLELEARQAESLAKAVSAAAKASALSLKRYQKGLVNYYEVVDSERSELDAERNFLNLQGNRYIAAIQLIKALGGSWDCPFPGGM